MEMNGLFNACIKIPKINAHDPAGLRCDSVDTAHLLLVRRLVSSIIPVFVLVQYPDRMTS